MSSLPPSPPFFFVRDSCSDKTKQDLLQPLWTMISSPFLLLPVIFRTENASIRTSFSSHGQISMRKRFFPASARPLKRVLTTKKYAGFLFSLPPFPCLALRLSLTGPKSATPNGGVSFSPPVPTALYNGAAPFFCHLCGRRCGVQSKVSEQHNKTVDPPCFRRQKGFLFRSRRCCVFFSSEGG